MELCGVVSHPAEMLDMLRLSYERRRQINNDPNATKSDILDEKVTANGLLKCIHWQVKKQIPHVHVKNSFWRHLVDFADNQLTTKPEKLFIGVIDAFKLISLPKSRTVWQHYTADLLRSAEYSFVNVVIDGNVVAKVHYQQYAGRITICDVCGM